MNTEELRPAENVKIECEQSLYPKINPCWLHLLKYIIYLFTFKNEWFAPQQCQEFDGFPLKSLG